MSMSASAVGAVMVAASANQVRAVLCREDKPASSSYDRYSWRNTQMTRAVRTALFAALAVSAIGATPALADLAPGAKAPDFSAPAYLAGKPFTFNLADARKKGPVVLYFFPSAHTKGCNLEAHLFSEAADDF